MSALASLVNAYDRMAARGQVPPFGYSQEKIGFLIPLNPDGTVAHEPIDLRQGEGKKKPTRLMAVPQPAKLTSGIGPNFLWDKTAYVLGVTATEGKRTSREHEAFVSIHRDWLASSNDEGLQALLRFLENWIDNQFAQLGWPEEMKDQNIVFALESERLDRIMIHDRTAARELWARLAAAGEKNEAACLITGKHAPVARLHPAIKGVWGAQSSGASIVSFNLDAFESYGHEQGENAPVSEAAAFAYTSALNHFLERNSGHRSQTGDASTVFWADSSDAQAVLEPAVLRKSDNIQPNLAGEWMRAILTDSPYPLTLLSTLIMRLRADHDVNALRVAILKSILIKNFKMEVPVSLDPECKEPGYLLGRLFSVYEQIQVAALGRNVNATIKDKLYGAASAQPRKVFRMLEAGSSNHLSKIGKQKPGLRVNLEKAVGAIMASMSPDQDPFPASLPDKSQALFGLGYYHQRNQFFHKSEKSISGETS